MPECEMESSASGPLKGIRVLDFGAYLAGSYHATLMGDLGADVIKVEPLAGDPTRLGPPFVAGESRVFVGWNRNKRGLAVDIRNKAGLNVDYDTFSAIKWRIAEVSDLTRPDYDPAERKYEIVPVWESDEITTYSLSATIPADALEPGRDYRARVRIVTDEKEQVILVPRTALFRGNDGGWQTYKVENGRAVLSNLEIGLSNNYVAEVINGLKPGDVVIDAPESSIQDGLKISVAE